MNNPVFDEGSHFGQDVQDRVDIKEARFNEGRDEMVMMRGVIDGYRVGPEEGEKGLPKLTISGDVYGRGRGRGGRGMRGGRGFWC